MSRFIANLITLGIAVTLILLAAESNSFMKWFGYGYGVVIFVAVIVNWSRATKN